MTATNLDALTPELFEMAIQHLGLEDIRHLRLVSRETCFRATQDRFISFFARKNVELTQSGLEEFAHMTSQGRSLGCLVRQLTLTGVLYDLSALGWFLKQVKMIRYPLRSRSKSKKECSEQVFVAVQQRLKEMQRL